MREYDVFIEIVCEPNRRRKEATNYIISNTGINRSDLDIAFIEEGAYRINSSYPRTMHTDKHIESIMSKINQLKPLLVNDIVKEIKIRIGVICDEAYCSDYISGSSLKDLIAFFPEIKVIVTYYPNIMIDDAKSITKIRD